MSDEMAMDAGNVTTEETSSTEGGNTLLTGTDDVQTGQETQSEAPAESPAPEEGQGEKAEEKQPDNDWELDVPEGVNPEQVKTITEGCKLLGMSKEVSQKVLEQRVKEIREWDQKQRDWRDELAADKEFGGTNYGETVTMARKALSMCDPDGHIRKMLNDTGYGNNPEVIKAFARVGKAMGEDVVISGKGGAAAKPLADRLYND